MHRYHVQIFDPVCWCQIVRNFKICTQEQWQNTQEQNLMNLQRLKFNFGVISDDSVITSAGRWSPRHYIAQRGSDADENSRQGRMQQGFCANRCECPADYDVVRTEILQHRERHRPTACLYFPYSGFIRGHCGKVANKAPSGREIGASAQAAILSQPRAVPARAVHLRHRAVLQKLSTLNIRQRPVACLPSQACACKQPRVHAAMANGRCFVALILNQSQACPAYFKGGVTTLKLRQYGRVGLRGVFFNREKPALPLTRHCQVVLGVVPHDRFA